MGTIVTQNVFDYKQSKVKTLIQHAQKSYLSPWGKESNLTL